MKRIDKLILSSFLGPFFLTFLVVVFILLTQHMIKYFDDIVGKDLGWDVLGTLLFYFAVFMTPIAIPLAVLLSSLITFGNLGEHFELTAIKASGISLLRALLPIFAFVSLLTVFAFYSNNTFVPRAALEAYSLLWDIKQKKPSMDLKEGAFYNGIPDISIKVEEKYDDGQKLKDIIIYDHTKKNGNKEVTIADSGRMFTSHNERYLTLELFSGNHYVEGVEEVDTKTKHKQEFTQSSFQRSQIVLDLSSFNLDRSDKDLFATNRNMRNISELEHDSDSMSNMILENKVNNFEILNSIFRYVYNKDDFEMPKELKEFKEASDTSSIPSISAEQNNIEIAKLDNPKKILGNSGKPDQKKRIIDIEEKKEINLEKAIEEYHKLETDNKIYTSAVNNVRHLKTRVEGNKTRIERAEVDKNVYDIQWHKIISNSFACIIMFLIGAPLGAIIKRGGLGIPVLVSILFFIIFYVFNMTGEKYAKQGLLEPWIGIWSANILLLPIGLFFLRQARVDARLFDSDFYNVILDRVNRWIIKKRKRKALSSSN